MELCPAAKFSIKIALHGGWIWISACSLDEGDQPELLFNIGDGAEGWVACAPIHSGP